MQFHARRLVKVPATPRTPRREGAYQTGSAATPEPDARRIGSHFEAENAHVHPEFRRRLADWLASSPGGGGSAVGARARKSANLGTGAAVESSESSATTRGTATKTPGAGVPQRFASSLQVIEGGLV